MTELLGGNNVDLSNSLATDLVHKTDFVIKTDEPTNSFTEEQTHNNINNFSGNSNDYLKNNNRVYNISSKNSINSQNLNCPECSKPCSSFVLTSSAASNFMEANCYNCGVCYTRFNALTELEAHAASKVSYFCCICQAGFHCREKYESHIREHKSINQPHKIIQQTSMNNSSNEDLCDLKNSQGFQVETLNVSQTTTSSYLTSLTSENAQSTQLTSFSDLTKLQQQNSFSNNDQNFNFQNQDAILNDNNMQANNNIQVENKNVLSTYSLQQIPQQQQSLNNNIQNQQNILQFQTLENQQQTSQLQQQSDSQIICTLCGKIFKNKITLAKHARSVHKVEGGAGADFLDFLSSSMTAVTTQQTSPNSAVPGMDKINLLENSNLGEAVFSTVSREQVSNLVDDMNGGQKSNSPGKKKRRKGVVDLSTLPRYRTSRVKYVCEVCDKEFIDKMKHRVHLRTHTGEKPFACEICSKRFNTRSQVNRHHLHIHELEGKPRNRQFKNQLASTSQAVGGGSEVKTCQNEAVMQQNIDLKNATLNNSTINNNVSLNENNNLNDDNAFGSNIQLNNVKNNHNATLNSTLDLKNISMQFSNENDTENMQQQLSSTSSPDKSLNTSTEATSLDPLSNSIVYCSKTGQPVEMNESGASVHRRKRGLHRIYFCPVCAKPFRDKVKHAVHLRTHTGEKPHACIICDKHFNTRSQVNRHMSVHKMVFHMNISENGSELVEGGEGIKAEMAGKEDDGTQAEAKSRKKRTRDWIQHHMCSLCGQHFATPSGLSSHTRSRHKDQLIFNQHLIEGNTNPNNTNIRSPDGMKICPVCGKAFRTANSLRMHMVRHSTVKPHKCPTCEKSFITKFECNRCERRHVKNNEKVNNNVNKNNMASNGTTTQPMDNLTTTLTTSNESNQPSVVLVSSADVKVIIPSQNNNTINYTNNNNTAISSSSAATQKNDMVVVMQADCLNRDALLTNNFIDNNNLPVNLSNQDTWLPHNYNNSNSMQQQQQQQHFLVTQSQQQPYQQQQQQHSLLQQYHLLQQNASQTFLHDSMLQSLTQDMLSLQQQQLQQQQQQIVFQQQNYHDSNNSKRRRKII